MLLQLGDRLEVLELVGASTMSVYKVVKVVGKKVYRKMIYEREEGAMPFAFKLNQRVTSRVSGCRNSLTRSCESQ